MRADRHEALVDFLLEAVADEGTTPFSANVLAGMRRVVRCEAVTYLEWDPQEMLECSLAADDPASILPSWRAYPQVSVGSQVIGFAGTDNKGLAGLEVQYDKSLSGKPGRQTIVRDPFGRAINVVSTTPERLFGKGYSRSIVVS